MYLICYKLQNGNSCAQFISERKEPFNWTKGEGCRLLSVNRRGQVKYMPRACDWVMEKEGRAKSFREWSERQRAGRRTEKEDGGSRT